MRIQSLSKILTSTSQTISYPFVSTEEDPEILVAVELRYRRIPTGSSTPVQNGEGQGEIQLRAAGTHGEQPLRLVNRALEGGSVCWQGKIHCHTPYELRGFVYGAAIGDTLSLIFMTGTRREMN